MSPSRATHAEESLLPTYIAHITVRDGVSIAAAVYLPDSNGTARNLPTLFAASPYRFDNNVAPAMPVFLWRETGPIEWYLEQGYAFVHMDVRGTGRSEGDYRYMDKAEQHDLYDVIEWIAAQPWSNGKVGGVGQSYYARMQWFMGIKAHPALACIAPYDGNVDTYRNSAYTGGIPGDFPGQTWFNGTVRSVNQYPATGPSKLIEWDYALAVRQHPTYDDFWHERCAAEQLARITVPLLSIGVWRKVDLHLNGNIVGYLGARGPKKMLVFGSATLQDAVQDFSSVAFHERYLLPFYDRYLKGLETSYEAEPAIRYFASGASEMRTCESWPPTDVDYRQYYLDNTQTGSVDSLNDGHLGLAKSGIDAPPTAFNYPNPGWRIGCVGMDAAGRPDPARRVITFTSDALEGDLELAGPAALVLYASSSCTDTDFIVKISEQYAQSPQERSEGMNPKYQIISKGWLRASHRELDASRSTPPSPYYTHTKPQPIEPGEVYRFEIAIMPLAHRLRRGSRLRLEIANADSATTEFVFTHEYSPRKVGTDLFFHDQWRASHVILPIRKSL